MSSIKNALINSAEYLKFFFPFCCLSRKTDNSPSSAMTFSSKILECFPYNISEILLCRGKGAFIQRKGKLIFCPEEILAQTSRSELEQGLLLVKQVLRQAWGKVVEAQCAIGSEDKGPMLLEEAIHRVDILQERLRQILPSEIAPRILADEKWASILANNYKATSEELLEKFKKEMPSIVGKSPLRMIERKLKARDKAIHQYREMKKGEFSFLPLTKEMGGVNFQGTKFVSKGDERCAVSKRGTEDVGWETSDLAWLNELLGAAFDQICGCRFGTAASTVTLSEEELSTIHSFKKSDGDRWHEAFDKSVNLKSSHQFVLFNILLKTQDAHKRNILYRRENNQYFPIPIDLGRLLSPTPARLPESMLRFTHFVKWGTLDQKFDEETKEFVKNLDPKQVTQSLRQLFINHPSLKPAQNKILEKKLLHLYANILMVKEALQEDITPRQLIALSTFKLTQRDLLRMKAIAEKERHLGRRVGLMRHYMLKYCYCAFLRAWNEARSSEIFKEREFIHKIRRGILKIKEENVSESYFYPAAMQKFEGLYL